MAVAPAEYIIKVRDSNLVFQGQVDAFDRFEMNPRYNNVGSWQLQLADDAPMASLLATPGYGVYVLRNGSYYFSGPVRYIDRKGIASNSLIVGGYDDLFWLFARQAYPGGFDPYPAWITFNNVLRAYSFGDTSGTTAVDFAPFTNNGTYTGTVTLNQAGLVDDPSKATLLGGNGWVSVPSFGLPAANTGYGIMVWFYYTGAPAATEVLGFIGTAGGVNCSYMGILTTGKPTMQVKGVNTNAAAALTVGLHCMWLDYDATTAKLYVDGVVVCTATPGVCTIAYGNAAFGCYGAGASNFAQSTIQYGCIFQGHLGNASLSGSQLNGLPWPQVYYSLGLSLFNVNTYDTETGPAETVLKTYVNNNAGLGAVTARQVPNLSIETDAAQGSTVTFNARFDQLMQMDMSGLLQVLANAGGVGFKVIHTAGTGLIFKVFVPATMSAAKFSNDLGNLGEYEYIIDAMSLVNAVVVGGGGTGVNRTFYQTTDAASLASWGRVEGFVNGGSSTTQAQLINQASNALSNGASKLSFTGVFYETDGLLYVRDFNLGDRVSVVVDGAVLTDIVREVNIKLDPQNGETLTIGIGTPAAGQILGALGHFQRQVQQAQSRLTLLERV